MTRPNTKVLSETASQTAGPYVHIGLAPIAAGFAIYEQEAGKDIAGPNAKGERIRVEGIVWYGNGDPVKDVLLEIWQPNAAGVYVGDGEVEDGFRGWGRVICDFDTGEWSFDTIKPGCVSGNAPHLSLWIVARGVNIGLNTRMYFPDEADLNSSDPVLSSLDQSAQYTLIANRVENAEDNTATYRFEIILQGEGETVFFDI